MRALVRTPQDAVEQLANQFRPRSAHELARAAPIGREETVQEMTARAELLKAMEAPTVGASPAANLAMQALRKKAEDAYAYGQAASALEQQALSDVPTPRAPGEEGLAGFSHAQRMSPGERVLTTQASVMAGNKALTGQSAPKGYTATRDADPRLGVQYRNEMERRNATAMGALKNRAANLRKA